MAIITDTTTAIIMVIITVMVITNMAITTDIIDMGIIITLTTARLTLTHHFAPHPTYRDAPEVVGI